ncbi:protein FAM72A [Cladochytrium replicatum]|nr:protein FAM72A [Cladochytrium replicatum]
MPLFHASVHQSFRSKSVYQINCASCNQVLCQRGMKAILLANINVTLFSTDVLPEGRVELVNDIYPTSQCKCKIREIACLGCGNVVGYHITQPCKNCLSACNNGHVWMFHDQQVQGIHRLVSTNGSKMKWGDLPSAKTDLSYVETIETICR